MKIIKNPAFMFILGVVTCTITTVLASSLIANNISYTPQDKTWGVTNVGAALDSLMLSKTSDNYSTDEKVVGTWIDGKPIYQKTVSIKAPTNTSGVADSNMDISSWNVDNMIELKGFNDGTTASTSVNGYSYGTYDQHFELMTWFNKSDNKLWVRRYTTNANNSGVTVYLTAVYTKTTD